MKKQHSASPQKTRSILQTIRITLILTLTVIGALVIHQTYTKHCQEQAAIRLGEISNHNSGATLDEVITTIQTEMPEWEIIFVFDENNQKLIEYTNESPYYVGLPKEAINLLKNFKNLKHFHTHPMHDNPHSDGDLGMLTRVGLAANVNVLGVIATHHVYTLINNHHAWLTDHEIWQYSNSLYERYGYFEEADLMQMVVIDGTTYPYLTTKFLSQFATDLGYTFQVQTSS